MTCVGSLTIAAGQFGTWLRRTPLWPGFIAAFLLSFAWQVWHGAAPDNVEARVAITNPLSKATFGNYIPDGARVESIFVDVTTLSELESAVSELRIQADEASKLVTHLSGLHDQSVSCDGAILDEVASLSLTFAGKSDIEPVFARIDVWLEEVVKFIRVHDRTGTAMVLFTQAEFARARTSIEASHKALVSLLSAIPRFLKANCSSLATTQASRVR